MSASLAPSPTAPAGASDRAEDPRGPEPPDPMVGRSLDDRYTLIAKLGAGSMGAVYRAKQHAMGREVAVKILRSDKALDEPSKARFLREARATSLLTSPHTVTVFDFGQTAGGELYLAMEILEGESLGQRLSRERRLPPAMAVETARQALRSLAEAHAKGIVHRDLKPDNLFYSRVAHGGDVEEVVKVLDFGIAKMLGAGKEPINAIETQAGTVFGTPRYMSPEQAQAKPLDGRTDLYSLGVLLYHMLSGRPPFTDDDAILVMARHIRSAPKPLREVAPDVALPPELEAVVMRALSKKPDDRPATAELFAAELVRALDPTRIVTTGSYVPPPPGPPVDKAGVTDGVATASIAVPVHFDRAPRRWAAWLAASAAALLVVAAVVVLLIVSPRARAPFQRIVSAYRARTHKAAPAPVTAPAAEAPVATPATPPVEPSSAASAAPAASASSASPASDVTTLPAASAAPPTTPAASSRRRTPPRSARPAPSTGSSDGPNHQPNQQPAGSPRYGILE